MFRIRSKQTQGIKCEIFSSFLSCSSKWRWDDVLNVYVIVKCNLKIMVDLMQQLRSLIFKSVHEQVKAWDVVKL